MEENNEKVEQKNVESEIKKQAKEAFEQTKNEIKNTNLKEETEKGKNLVKDLISKPIQTLQNIVNEEGNKLYVLAMILLGVWVVRGALGEIIYSISYKYHDFSFWSLIKDIIEPVLAVVTATIAIIILNKENKKSFIKTITCVVIAKVPVIISSILGLLTYISSNATYLTSPISSILSVISTVFMFFTVKELLGKKENEDAFKSFVLVMAIYYVVSFVLRFLEIYI